MTALADLQSAALFELLCEERAVLARESERDEARALEAEAREILLARADAGHAIAAALPMHDVPLAPLALHRHRVRCRVARALLAALPEARALEGILPRLSSAAPDVAEAVGLALLDKACRREAPIAPLLAPEVASIARRGALIAVAEQVRTAEVLEQVLDLVRRDIERDLGLRALAAAGPSMAGLLATLARGYDEALGSAALEQLQTMREAGRDGGLALPTARELLHRADAGSAGFFRAQVLCRVLLDDDAGDKAFACGDSGRLFASPVALVEGLRQWVALAEESRVADGNVRPLVERFDGSAFELGVPLPGGDVGLRPALGRLQIAPGTREAEGPRCFYRAPVHGLQAAGRTLYGYRFGTWVEGADPHGLTPGELLPPDEDPLGLAGLDLRPPEAPSAAWFARMAERLGRLRAGRYLAALLDVRPILHAATAPRPFWVPTRRVEYDEDDDREDDTPADEEPPPSLGVPFHVAHAAAADVAIAFLPGFLGEARESAELCVAYAWPRPEGADFSPGRFQRGPLRLYATVLAGEGALLRASRGGPPARVLVVAPCAVPGDDALLAGAFALLGGIPIS